MRRPAMRSRLKKIHRHFGATAPRMVVRSHWSWRVYAAAGTVLVLLMGAAWWGGMRFSDGAEVLALRERAAVQQQALDQLLAAATTGVSAARMDNAAQQGLLSRIKSLEEENAALREDLLLFQRLTPTADEGGGVRIEGFHAQRETPTRLRYRFLLGFQPNKLTPDFRGRFQLLATYTQHDGEHQLLIPEAKNSDAGYGVEVKHFLRREGVLEIPPGGVVKSVELLVLQGDWVKAKKTVQP